MMNQTNYEVGRYAMTVTVSDQNDKRTYFQKLMDSCEFDKAEGVKKSVFDLIGDSDSDGIAEKAMLSAKNNRGRPVLVLVSDDEDTYGFWLYYNDRHYVFEPVII